MMIRPLANNILFKFLNDTESDLGKFKEVTSFGLELIADTDDSAKRSRWAIVSYIGPEVKDIEVGDYICIAPLRWTDSFKYKRSKFWKTNDEEVMLVSKDKPSIYV